MKALLWDLNGVLIDDEPVQMRCWEQALGESDVDLPPDWWQTIFLGKKASATLANLLSDWSPERRANLLKRKESLYRKAAAEGLPRGPGSLEMLREAQSRGITQALVTGASEDELRQAFRSTPVQGVFETIVAGADVSRGKPDPEGYLVACQRLGLSPGECWAIEDSPAGIQAAKSAGVRCVGLTTSFDAEELQEADLVLDSLSQSLLDQLG